MTLFWWFNWILIVSAIILWAYFMSCVDPDREHDGKAISLWILACIIVLSTNIYTQEESYKRGQVDALKGEQHYELNVQTERDSTYVRTE